MYGDDPDTVIANIKTKKYFKKSQTTISVSDLKYIKNTQVLKYLCENGNISMTKSDIINYHKLCYFHLLNVLLENNFITKLSSSIIVNGC